MSKQMIGYLVILIGAGLAIAGLVLAVKHPAPTALVLVGAAAIIVGYWISKNLKS